MLQLTKELWPAPQKGRGVTSLTCCPGLDPSWPPCCPHCCPFQTNNRFGQLMTRRVRAAAPSSTSQASLVWGPVQGTSREQRTGQEACSTAGQVSETAQGGRGRGSMDGGARGRRQGPRGSSRGAEGGGDRQSGRAVGFSLKGWLPAAGQEAPGAGGGGGEGWRAASQEKLMSSSQAGQCLSFYV